MALCAASQAPIDAPFVSAPPRAQLVNAFAEPYNNAVATARTCYSSRIITTADVTRDEQARALRDEIAASTYAAGHHTTLQHATFQFALTNVSRQLLWSFLHAHPFYNSEQVSQRYVAVKPDHVLVPRLPPAALDIYQRTVVAQMQCYHELCELLREPAAEAYFRVFPARAKRKEDHAGDIQKRAQEVARYALPVATFAHLYHTVSALTLHRYHRLCQMPDVPTETRVVVQAMVDAVTQHDPLFCTNIEDPIPLEHTHEHTVLAATRTVTPTAEAREFRRLFDEELGEHTSLLCDYKVRGEELLARSVRTMTATTKATLSDDAAIAWVLSPEKNPYLGGALNLVSLGKLTRAMMHPHYTFQKKLSHTADSQDQRHRLTPATRPLLSAQYVGGEPDVVLPKLLQRTPQALDRFMATMRQTFLAIDALLDSGIDAELALYLLPNAFPIRFEESGDLAAWHHKWTTRLCYTAQEEIWHATFDEVRQLRKIQPRIGQAIAPPCGVRHSVGIKPCCPEGKRFCGVPVWKLAFDEYERT